MEIHVSCIDICEMQHFFLKKVCASLHFVVIKPFSETAECPVTDWLFSKMCRMQSILVAHITADGFDQFIVSKPVVFFQHKASNDEIDRCIWPRSIVVAIKNSKAFFIDSREHNISKIFTPGIHDYLLRSWRKIYKTIIQSDLLILVCFKGHIGTPHY